MTREQEEIAEKIIELIRTSTNVGNTIYKLVNRDFDTAYIQKHKVYDQVIPILRDGDEKGIKYIKKPNRHSDTYQLTDAGINFTTYEDIRRKEAEEQQRLEDSHKLTKEQLKVIEESRVLSERAEKRAEKAERRSKRAGLRSWIALGISTIPLIILFIKWLISLKN